MAQFVFREEAERVLAGRTMGGDFEFAGHRLVPIATVGEIAALRRFFGDCKIVGPNAGMVENDFPRIVERDTPDFDVDDGATMSRSAKPFG